MNKEVHTKSWLIQLATRTKRRVHRWVRSCAFEFSGMPTSTHLNMFALGSYSNILGMASMFIHKTKVEFYEKAIECLDDDGEKRFLQGKKKHTLVRMVHLCRKSTVVGNDVYCL